MSFLGKNNRVKSYLIIERTIGEDSDIPSPELPININSTKHRFFLKYCPTITVALSRSIPIPMAIKDIKV